MKDNIPVAQAAALIQKTNNPSISLLRVNLGLSLEDAESIMDYFVAIGFISNYRTESPKVLSNYSFHDVTPSYQSFGSSFLPFDTMDGHDFEYFCADLLRYNGFSKVKVTSGSGDFGVDILCNYGSDSYAIQCKCYSHTIGNKAVQEVVSGKIYYKCQKAVVMTNNYFSAAAEETARLTNVDLWDRHRLIEMLRIAKANGFQPSLTY